MYVDDTGGAEETVTTDSMTVPGDGDADFEAEYNADLDADGAYEAAIAYHEDGSSDCYVDDDLDGTAEIHREFDEQGRQVAEARFDPEEGDWVAVDPDATRPAESSITAHAPDMPTDHAEAGMRAWMPPDGAEIRIPVPTIDSNDDGVLDTSVVEDADGTTYLFTDGDHDDDADYVMITYADGTIEAYEHHGGGEWTLVEPEEPVSSDESGGSKTDPAIVAALE